MRHVKCRITFKGNKESLCSKLSLPCIAHVCVEGKLLHYVVIHKITKKKMVIADPAKGIVRLSIESFCGGVAKKSEIPQYKWTGVVVTLIKKNSFKKGAETKGQLSRFLYLLLPQKKLIINAFIASAIYTILGIAAAFYFQGLLDSVLPNNLTKTLTTLTVGVILLNIFRVLLNALRVHLLLYMSQKLDIDLLLNYYRHVIKLPISFFSSRKVGEIVSRFNDASKVRDAISSATLTIMIDTVMATIGAIILYMQNSKMFR